MNFELVDGERVVNSSPCKMSADEVKLGPESKAFVDQVKKVGPIDLSLPVDSIRQLNEQTSERFKGNYVFNGSKEDQLLPAVDNGDSYELPVTILRPKVESEASWNNIMVYFHGGGWTRGSRNTHMKFCEMMAR